MRRNRVVSRSLLVVGCATLLLGACSTSGDEAGPARSTTTALVRPDTTSTAPTSSSGPPLTGTTQPAPPPDGSGLRFRPVIGSQPCSSVTPDTPPGDGPLSTETTIAPPDQPELVPAEDGVLCFGLGPAGATGEDLARAVADTVPETGAWTVLVTPKPEAEAKLNAVFDACFADTPACPAGEGGHGSVAIELDGKVISAPAVGTEGLGSSPFQISAAFTEQDAQALAARLNG